jgi:hypothetical protein
MLSRHSENSLYLKAMNKLLFIVLLLFGASFTLLGQDKINIFKQYYNGKDSTIKSLDFSYNGLNWTGDARQEKNSISQEEINRIDRYWRQTCHL